MAWGISAIAYVNKLDDEFYCMTIYFGQVVLGNIEVALKTSLDLAWNACPAPGVGHGSMPTLSNFSIYNLSIYNFSNYKREWGLAASFFFL